MFLGYRLRELRKSKAWSQADLGRMLGVTKVSISGYEKGTRVPSMSVLLLILKLFDVSADYILGNDVNVVCEDDGCSFLFGAKDIEIIKEIKGNPILYNKIAENPKRFFGSIGK